MADTDARRLSASLSRGLLPMSPRWRTLMLCLTLLALAYGLGLGVVLPHFAKPFLERALSDELSVGCSIRRLTFNPLTFKAIARDVLVPYPGSARETAGEYLLRLDRLELTLSPVSIAAKALLIDDLRFVRPAFAVSRFKDGTLSPQVFFPQPPLETEREKREDGLFPLVIHNITVEDGALAITDELRGTVHTVTDIQLTVPFASTLPSDSAVPLTPSLTAVVNGKPLSASGESRPFDETRRTVFTLRTRDLDLCNFREYIQPYTSLTLARGFAHTELTLRFTQDAERAFAFSLAGTAEVADLTLKSRHGTAFAAKRIAVEAENVVLGPRRIIINHMIVDQPEAVIRRGKDGSVDWMGFFIPPENLPPDEVRITAGSGDEFSLSPNRKAPSPTAPPLQLLIRELQIRGGRATWHDATAQTPVRYVAENINGSFTDVSSQEQGQADFSLAFGSGDAIAAVSGRAVVGPLRAEGSLDAKNLPLAPLYPYLPESNLRLEGGRLSASGAFAFQLAPDPVARITGGRAVLANVAAHVNGESELPLVAARRLTAEGITVDLIKKTAHIGTVSGTGFAASLKRDRAGNLALPAFVSPQPAGAGQAWKVDVGSLALTQSAFSFTDESTRRAVAFALSGVTVTGKNFATAGNTRWTASISGMPGDRGLLSLSARGAFAPLDISFSGKMEKTDIRMLSPYMRQASRIRLAEGTAGSDFTGRVRLVPGSERGGELLLKGDIGLYGVSLVAEGKELGGWGRLRAENFEYRHPPSGGRTCRIGAITVNNPRLAVTIDETGKSSLEIALEPQDSADRETGPEQGSATAARARAPSSPVFAAFSVGRISLFNGRAAYRDKRVSPPYALRMDGVNAQVANLSLDPAVYTSFVGTWLINGSPVNCSAVVQSLFDTPSGNGTLSIRSLDLSRFTQYAEKYLGYPLERGEMTLSAIGSLRGRDLSLHNSVLIRDLDLGAKVRSPHAPDLPLSAAVGLLRDDNGDISLELPVAGTLGDPEFKLGGVVGRVIGNVILKTVTSPLALVGGLLSGFADLLRRDDPVATRIVFPVGENTLDATARKELEALGKELRKHPRATVTITGMADMSEKNALIDAWVDKMLRMRKYKELSPEKKANTTPDGVLMGPEYDAREYSRLLFELYASMPFVQRSSDPEITSPRSTRAVMRILRSRVEIGEEELRRLARSRAIAVYHAVSGGKIDTAARLRILDSVLINAEETGDRIASYAQVVVIL